MGSRIGNRDWGTMVSECPIESISTEFETSRYLASVYLAVKCDPHRLHRKIPGPENETVVVFLLSFPPGETPARTVQITPNILGPHQSLCALYSQ